MSRTPGPRAAPPFQLRPLTAADTAAVLRLNAAGQPAVAPLTAAELANLLQCDGDHRVAIDERGEVVGYLLSFPRDSAYDDTEIAELRRLIAAPFVYICQVVIAASHRRQGIGHALYAEVETEARRRAASILCCDVNIEPLNRESLAFHEKLGFERIATGLASNGFAVAYLARKLHRNRE